MIVEISDENFENEVLKSNVPVLAECYVASCFKCAVLMAALDELDERHGNRVKLAKLNFANNKKTFSGLSIKGTPTFAIFKDGKELQRFHGDATVDDIKDFVDSLITD